MYTMLVYQRISYAIQLQHLYVLGKRYGSLRSWRSVVFSVAHVAGSLITVGGGGPEGARRPSYVNTFFFSYFPQLKFKNKISKRNDVPSVYYLSLWLIFLYQSLLETWERPRKWILWSSSHSTYCLLVEVLCQVLSSSTVVSRGTVSLSCPHTRSPRLVLDTQDFFVNKNMNKKYFLWIAVFILHFYMYWIFFSLTFLHSFFFYCPHMLEVYCPNNSKVMLYTGLTRSSQTPSRTWGSKLREKEFSKPRSRR